MTEPKKPKKERKSTKVKDAPSRSRISDDTNEFVYAICRKFIEQATGSDKDKSSNGKSNNKGITSSIAEWAKKKYDRPDITREKIYPYIWEGFRRGFVSLNPPKSEELRDQLVRTYELQDALQQCGGDVLVTDVSDEETAAKNVSLLAADTIIELLKSLQAKHDKEHGKTQTEDGQPFRVHIGFGGGYVAMEVARRLASINDAQIPKLTLHAITSNYYLDEPEKDASTYFSYFTQKQNLDVECIAFQTTPLVYCKSDGLAEHWKNPSLKSCYDKRKDVNIIVTSLADAEDEHGLLKKYFNAIENGSEIIKQLEDQKWIGDLLFHPFSENGPIFPKEVQTAPLFSFNELVNAAHGKSLEDANVASEQQTYVVLIGGPCADIHCKKTKERALFPLVNNDSMRVWTHLVLDSQTAKKLIAMKNQ